MKCYVAGYKGTGYRILRYRCFEKETGGTVGNEEFSYVDGSLLFGDGKKTDVDNDIAHSFFRSLDSGDLVEFLPDGIVTLYYDADADDNLLFVTSQCSSNCMMCPSSDGSRKEKEFTSPEQLCRIVSMMPEKLTHLTISGGEPFMIGTGLISVFEKIRNHDNNASVLLLTNGRAFCIPEIAAAFSRAAGGNVISGIPIHGYDAETHDAVSRASGSFVQTVAGIKNLLRNHCNVEVRIVVSRLNHRNMEQIGRFIARELKGVLRVVFIGLEMTGNAALYRKDVWLPYTEAFRSIKETVRFLVGEGITVSLYNFPLCTVEAEYRPLCAKSITDYKISHGDACEVCTQFDSCGGVFSSSLRYATKELVPFRT